MITSATALRISATDDCQTKFPQLLLIQQELNYAFRRLDAEARDEAVQDGVVNCYLAYVRLIKR